MAEEGQSDTTVSDVEEHMKQRYATKLLHVKKVVPTGIHQCLQIICGDQTVNASTVRLWVVCLRSDDSANGSPLSVRIFMSIACRLLIIGGKNAELLLLTM